MAKTITISVDEKTEKFIRRYATAKYGKRKGSLGRAWKDAADSLFRNKEQEDISKEAIELLNKGFKLGKLGSWRFNRAELHER